MKLLTKSRDKKRVQSQQESIDFKVVKARFFKINTNRYSRLCKDLRSNQRDFIELLPLLFHVNHPMLPGYITRDTPAGIPDFAPGQAALNIAKKISKSFIYKKRAYRRFLVHAIYVMGSAGTIAYGEKSDLDIWLCHDSELDAEQLDNLRSKALTIEHWARDMGVETSIFLVDAEKFREGELSTLSNESSGTALHYLLLEEFYRTSVLLAGSYPLWWLVPPEEERNYDDYVNQLKQKRFIHARDYIDFGGLGNISPGEFYGATLWLLYKGINSPYKSILKIQLMEAYAREYPNIDMLGMRFKKKVYEGESDINVLDPYLMMLDKVEEYLTAIDDQQRLELARNSFYMKVDQSLSENNNENDWRHVLLNSYVNKWHWPFTRLMMLDSRDSWKIKRVLEERKLLINEFMNSYRVISDFARNETDNSTYISRSDLNILGRKLFAAFERKSGKIDIVYRGITPDMLESHISIHHITSDEGQPYWMMFSGLVREKELNFNEPLHRAYSLVELLTWGFFNKIINRKTVIATYTGNSDLTDKELNLIITSLEKHFPDEVLETSTYDFRNPVRIRTIGTFINVGMDPFSAYSRQGNHLTSEQTDALRYGGRFENLALSIEQIIVTTWQEALTFRYFGVEGLFNCLRDYLQWSPPSSGRRPPSILAHSFSSYRGTSIARRIETLFENLINCFYSEANPENIFYVLGIEWEYYVLWMDGDVLNYSSPGNLEGLLDSLSRPQEKFRHVVFDNETLSEHVLPELYRENKAGVVQCFYEVKGEDAITYVLDEKGSLSRQTKKYFDLACLLNQYRDFFNIIHDRMQLSSQDELGQWQNASNVLYYRVEKLHGGKYQTHKHTINSIIKAEPGIRLQVLGDQVDGVNVFTVYCEDREFSSMVYGKQLFHEVAKHILSLRGSNENYPIYVTDVDVSFALLKSDPVKVQTSHYLNFKYRIESYLNQELEKL